MPGGSRYQQGNEVLDQLLYNASVTFPTLAGNASASTNVVIPGVLPLDLISWNIQNPPAHLVIDNIWASAANTITITWGTDSTGIAGATVALLFSICRGENANLGASSLPSALV